MTNTRFYVVLPSKWWKRRRPGSVSLPALRKGSNPNSGSSFLGQTGASAFLRLKSGSTAAHPSSLSGRVSEALPGGVLRGCWVNISGIQIPPHPPRPCPRRPGPVFAPTRATKLGSFIMLTQFVCANRLFVAHAQTSGAARLK